MRRLIRSGLIWISTVCKCVSELTWCPKLSDFTLFDHFIRRVYIVHTHASVALYDSTSNLDSSFRQTGTLPDYLLYEHFILALKFLLLHQRLTKCALPRVIHRCLTSDLLACTDIDLAATWKELAFLNVSLSTVRSWNRIQ